MQKMALLAIWSMSGIDPQVNILMQQLQQQQRQQ